MTDHTKLPHIRVPGRLIVKGNLVCFDPKGIPLNITCNHNAIITPPENFEYRPTDTVVDVTLSLQGDIYCYDLGG